MAGSSGDKFGAFISYSRGVSGQLAVDLQNGIERYAKPWNKLRAVRVFRDDSSMSANASLWSAIEVGLRESEWFILLATPEAAASDYVNNEVAWWVEHKSADRILLVRAGGDIEWDRGSDAGKSGGDFDRERSTAIPPALFGAHAEEPRWIDVTWYAQSESLGKSDPRFNERVVDLASAIRGIERDTLIGENVAQHRKTRRLTRGAIAGLASLLILALIAGGLALTQKAETEKQRATATAQRDVAISEANKALARRLASSAQQLAPSDMQSALRMAAYSYMLFPDSSTAQAMHDVNAASGSLTSFYEAGGEVTATAGTPDGRVVLAGTSEGKVVRWDLPGSEPTQVMALSGPISFIGVSDDGQTVVGSSAIVNEGEDKVKTVESTDSAVWQAGALRKLEYPVDAISPSGRTMASLSSSYVEAKGPAEGVVVHRKDGQDQVISNALSYQPVVLPDDTSLRLASIAGIQVIDLATGEARESKITASPRSAGVQFSSNGVYVADYETTYGQFLVYDTNQPAKGNGFADSSRTITSATELMSAFSLNDAGDKVASSANGVIYIANVDSPSGESAKPMVLGGAGGVTAGTLKWLNETLLVSGSGTSLAIWDLNQTSRLGRSVTGRIQNSVSANPPDDVAVNPSGTRAAVLSNMQPTDVFIANLDSASSREMRSIPGSTASSEPLLLSAISWLDDERLVGFSANTGRLYVLSGPLLETLDKEIQIKMTDFGLKDESLTGFGLNYGQVPMVAGPGDRVRIGIEQVLLEVDTQSGKISASQYPGGSFSPDGTKTVLVQPPSEREPASPSASTRLVVFEIDGARTLIDQIVPGVVNTAVPDEAGGVYIWREDPRSLSESNVALMRSMEVELAQVAPQDGGETVIASVPPAFRNREVSSQYLAVQEWEGNVSTTDVRTGITVPLTTVDAGVGSQWTNFGFSRDGAVLVISSPEGTVQSVISGSDALLRLACSTASGDMSDEEWSRIAQSTVVAKPSCAALLPS